VYRHIVVASKAPPLEPRIRWVFFNSLLGSGVTGITVFARKKS